MKYGLMFSAFGGGGMAQSTFAALKQSVGAVAKYLFLTADFLNELINTTGTSRGSADAIESFAVLPERLHPTVFMY